MNYIFFLISLILITGCEQQEKPRQYAETVSEVPVIMPQTEGQRVDNPHAGIDLASKITPDAKVNLQKMIAEGHDPHAGMDMAAFGGKDPHAGLDMPAIMGSGASVTSSYSWILPKGWKQGSNKGPMRLASFYIEEDPDAIDCSIVSLAGMAGGLEGNLKRWMGQVAIESSDTNLQKLINTAETIQTQGGLQAIVYDLTALKNVSANKSMIAAIISDKGATVFVKITGTSVHLKQNRDGFFELLKSLASKQ